jgi:YHS domain-containing protein
MNRRHLMLTAFATTAIAVLPNLAFAKKASVYTGFISGVGAGGYDVVSYFNGGPKKGSAKYAASYNGAKWYFTTAENLKTFQASPGKYAPAFGGYCAYAVANGATAAGKAAQSRWIADIPGNISSGNTNWPDVLN